MTKLTDERLANICRAPWQDLDDVTNDEIVSMSDELKAARAQLAKMQLAAPVMLTVMALLSDEADLAGLRESALWFYDQDPDHLETWLDAEHARAASPVNGGDDE